MAQADIPMSHAQAPQPAAAARCIDPLRWPAPLQWLFFVLQVLLVGMVQAGNDIVRGNIFPPNAHVAMENALQVVDFEKAHGFFMEPAIQLFFRRSHELFGMVFTWHDVVLVSNNIYAFCHLFVTLGVGVWIFLRHRDRFPFIRNVMLTANMLALVGYEVYPLAPPRLLQGLIYDHHPFFFIDTMQHILGGGKLNGTPIGYNPYSAMPSVHMVWAIIMGATLVLLARPVLLRALGAIYPAVMLCTVVVTANHFLMDAVGAALDVGVSVMIVLVLSRLFWSAGQRLQPAPPFSPAHSSPPSGP